ncbi:MAG: hypothetical protein OXC72_14985 [Roseovarius sp.]|nr:hypothetical protein [Roseovarius sp.]
MSRRARRRGAEVPSRDRGRRVTEGVEARRARLTLKLSGDGPVDGNGGADSGKNGTEPWLRKMWRMPPKENAGLAHDMDSTLSRPVAGSLTGTRPWSACQGSVWTRPRGG